VRTPRAVERERETAVHIRRNIDEFAHPRASDEARVFDATIDCVGERDVRAACGIERERDVVDGDGGHRLEGPAAVVTVRVIHAEAIAAVRDGVVREMRVAGGVDRERRIPHDVRRDRRGGEGVGACSRGRDGGESGSHDRESGQGTGGSSPHGEPLLKCGTTHSRSRAMERNLPTRLASG
jgi:hypothetical protein